LWKQVDEGKAGTLPKFYPNGSIGYLTQIDAKLSSAWSELLRMWEEDAAEESVAADVLNAG
jgi:hypothetical protein